MGSDAAQRTVSLPVLLPRVGSEDRGLEHCSGFAEKCRARKQEVWRDPRRRHLVITLGITAAWVLTGLYMFTSSPWDDSGEYYSLIDSLYVLAQIITTVGYGDMCAKSKTHLWFISFYVLTAVMTLSSIAGLVAERIVASENDMIVYALENMRTRTLQHKATANLHHILPEELASNIERGYERLPDAQSVADAGARCLETSLSFLPRFSLSQEMGAFIKAVGIWSSFVLVWVLFFCLNPWEPFDLVESFYMAVITLTTVGYGDKTPATQAGRLFATVWMLGGVGAFANLVGKFSAVFVVHEIQVLDKHALDEIRNDNNFQQSLEDRHKRDQQQAERWRVQTQSPKAEAVESKPPIHRDEFIIFMLQKMQVVDEEVIAKLSQNFDQLDADGNGCLDETDIEDVKFALPLLRPKRRLGTR